MTQSLEGMAAPQLYFRSKDMFFNTFLDLFSDRMSTSFPLYQQPRF